MKKFLFSFFMCLFTLIGFGSCDYLISNNSFTQNYNQNRSVQLNSSNQWKYSFSDYGVYCNKGGNYSGDIAYYKSDGSFIGWLTPNACIYGGSNEVYMYSNDHTNLNFYVVYMYLPGSIYTGVSNCEVMSSLECQTEYGLIPVSSVDQSYCEFNDLCPVSDNLSGDLVFSNVYINDILHPGRASIFVNIPDYISWDYSVNDIDFNINVGSGYDPDYIDSLIAINSYRPTTEDFTNVFVGGLTLIMPYVMIILFIVFVRKFIKRIFK